MRGISSVVSLVLLIAISVAAALSIYLWSIATLAESQHASKSAVLQLPPRVESAYCSCMLDIIAYFGFQQLSNGRTPNLAAACGAPEINAVLEDTNTTNSDGNTPPIPVDGSYRTGLKFDGVDDAVVVDYDFNFTEHPFAVLAHVYPFFTISNPPSTTPIVFEAYASYRLYVSGSDLVFVIHAADGNYYGVSLAIPAPALQTPSWHRVLGYADANKVCVGFDGNVVCRDISGSGGLDREWLPHYIGHGVADWGGDFNGIIDEVAYLRFGAPQSPGQLASLMVPGAYPPVQLRVVVRTQSDLGNPSVYLYSSDGLVGASDCNSNLSHGELVDLNVSVCSVPAFYCPLSGDSDLRVKVCSGGLCSTADVQR